MGRYMTPWRLGLALLAGGTFQAAAASPTAQDLVAQNLSAVVSISVLRGPPPSVAARTVAAARVGRVLGSGFIIDPDGTIVTNRHVVEDAKDILITLQDSTVLHATIIAEAEQTDIALLHIASDAPLPRVRFGDSDAIQVADPVFAIGNPLGLGGSVSQGIVSALNRDIKETAFDDFIQTDAAINHGNSGGPLFNLQGEVIGMNTAIFSPEATSGSIGLNFAIPSNDVRLVVDALRASGGMHIGTLDFRIQQVTPEIADALNMPRAEGAIVAGMKDGGGASLCGIVAGDIILRYGNLKVKDVRALARAIAQTPPGTAINLTIWRDNEPMVVTAAVGELKHAERTIRPSQVPTGPTNPGWRLARIGQDSSRTAGPGRAPGFVVVADVDPDGAAAEAGLKPGDVILQVQQEKMAGPDDVAPALSRAWRQQRRYVVVLVRNAAGLRWLALSLS